MIRFRRLLSPRSRGWLATSSHRWLANVILGLFLTLFFGSKQPQAAEEGQGTTLAGAQAPKFELKAGDHICIIGNALAERMQHDGWLETLLYARFPKHDLVFRNLGYNADELTIKLRSQDFGTPDQWLSASAPIPNPKALSKNAPVRQNRFELTNTKADVIFAFFGYNESFAGEAGLPKFKSDLEKFIKHTLSQKYNGSSAPRLVLFSPTANENLHDRNLPDGTANNARIKLYTAAMAEVARANGVVFVDLFRPTEVLFAKAVGPFTINGVHLNERGNKAVAEIIHFELFREALPAPPDHYEKLRQAVLDKNFYWFQRYRVTDGYSTYGGRAFLKFTGGQSNYEVAQRELEVLDVMTSNRDKNCWAVAKGENYKVDDSNAPPLIPVTTNKPGPLPGGKHKFLDADVAIGSMKVAKGMKINLFASEKDFPDLINPVQMAYDPAGRLWVAAWNTYPHWKPGDKFNDKLLIFEDTKGTGKADKMTVFADNLSNPTGFEFWNGGVLVAQAPDLVFLKDTKGTGKADLRVRMIGGLDSADTHHTSNSFAVDPGGAFHFQEGTFHHTQVETVWNAPARCANAGVFRYEPRTQKFDVYIAFGFANPHGHVFTRWGADFVWDGTGAVPTHAVLFSGQTDYPQRHANPPHLYQQRTRPCPGVEVLSSRHFPPESQGNLLVGNVIGFQGILQYKLSEKGASFKGTEVEPIVSSSDPNFRPADIKIGPDGAIYFCDWHNPIIGHMQHNLRDPNRNKDHGRIYRVTYEGRELLKPVKVAGEPIAALLDLLKEPEDRVRHRVRTELGARPTDEVMAALSKWVANLDKSDAEYEHHMLEALWLHQNHNVMNLPLLQRMLRSSDHRARTAATRVLCYMRAQVPNPLDLLRVQINDSHPQVRLEAIRSLSFFREEKALAIALEVLAHPDDEYIRFVFNETLNTLERRLGGGLNRKDIAGSVLKLLDQPNIEADRKGGLIEIVCRQGGAKELTAIWTKAEKAKEFSPALRKRVLELLGEAARLRKVQPTVAKGAVERLLADSARDDGLQSEVIRLAAIWKVKEASQDLRRLAGSKETAAEPRLAAIDALAVLADPENRKTLTELAEKAQPLSVRFRAAVALSQLDLEAGALSAAAALAASTDNDDVSPVVEAFLVRKGGSDRLAAALEKNKLTADQAKRVLRAMYLAGSNDLALGNVVGRYAGLDAIPKAPTPAEVTKIAAEVMVKGDAARGEKIFRRADVGCMKCHAVSKAGGNIGPDLGPIGASSPMDYIITSILDPSASIKEEYLTKVIATVSGKVVTGIVVSRDKNQVVLKDATGKKISIPIADIDDEQNGKSLMPEGITRLLTQGELLDLVRFVSELGKPGPYALRNTPAVRRWKTLRQLPAALKEGVPNREVIRENILRSSDDAWDVVYARVDGSLPLEDLRKPGSALPAYVQGEFKVLQEGPIEFRVESSEPVVIWIDEEMYEKGPATVTLRPGRHTISVRVAGESRPGTLRVELTRPAGSQASFEPIHGGE